MKRHSLLILLAALSCVACKKTIPNVVDESRQALADSAASGNVDAQYQLAWQFDAGMDGGTIDRASAAMLYEQAADGGNPKAQCMLAYYMLTGEGGIDRDTVRANELFTSCAEPLAKAAEAGDTESQYYAGMMHYMGFPPYDVDYEKAFAWFEKAATAGHAGAQEWLANMYYRGQGCEKSIPKTRIWLVKAARQGNKNAQSALKMLSRH